MDDFIDDSEANPSQISAMIGQMFGYDRRKFRYVSFSRILFLNFFLKSKHFFYKFRNEDDFDDRSMENNKFSSIMKEEAYSARIGRQEDLEDMRRYVSFSRIFFTGKIHKYQIFREIATYCVLNPIYATFSVKS